MPALAVAQFMPAIKAAGCEIFLQNGGLLFRPDCGHVVLIQEEAGWWVLPQAVDAVEGEGAGGGVGPDAVADVVHDAPIGDGDADVVGALAADLPPDDVAGLDGLVRGDDLPVGVVGQVGADVGDAPVVDVGVGRFVRTLSVLVDFLLQIQSAAAQGADHDVGADACRLRNIPHGEVDVDICGVVVHKVVEL